MSEATTETPKAIHHSHQFQQQDLGDTIRLYAGEGPLHQGIIGTIYNFEDIPYDDPEKVEARAIAIADKIVRAYGCHDDLLADIELLLQNHDDMLSDIEDTPGQYYSQFPDRAEMYRKIRADIAKAKGEPNATTV